MLEDPVWENAETASRAENQTEIAGMPSSERRKEIKRRRHRRKKIDQLKRRAEKATVSEKAVIAQKIRELSPGGDEIVEKLGLEER